MPVVQPDPQWSPYPVGHRDPKPVNSSAHCNGLGCSWRGKPEQLAIDSGRKRCPRCSSLQVTETYGGVR